MELRITLQKQDYAALYRQLINKRLFWLSAAPLLLAIPLSAFILVYTGLKNNASLVVLLIPFALIAGLAAWIFYRAGHAPAMAQYREAQQGFGAAFAFDLAPDVLRCRAGGQAHDVSYRAFERVLETPKHIFYFINQSEAFIFPKSQLDEAALALLHEKAALAGTDDQSGALA